MFLFDKLFIEGVDEALLLTDDEADEFVDVEFDEDVDEEENFVAAKPGGGTMGLGF